MGLLSRQTCAKCFEHSCDCFAAERAAELEDIVRQQAPAIDIDAEMDKADAAAETQRTGYVRTTAKKERERERLKSVALQLAKDGAFDKSEELFPMRGDPPTEVFADKQFRALFHLWKRGGSKKDDPRIQKMRERWMAITAGIEVIR